MRWCALFSRPCEARCQPAKIGRESLLLPHGFLVEERSEETPEEGGRSAKLLTSRALATPALELGRWLALIALLLPAPDGRVYALQPVATENKQVRHARGEIRPCAIATPSPSPP